MSSDIQTDTTGLLFFDENGEIIDNREILEFNLEEGWFKIRKKDSEGKYEEVDGEPVRLRIYGEIQEEIKEEEIIEETEEEIETENSESEDAESFPSFKGL